jgi:TonB family protein
MGRPNAGVRRHNDASQGGTVRSTLFTLAAVAAVSFVALPAAGQDQVYKPGNGVKTPVLVHEVKPQYTKDAMARKVQGVVEMQCVVLSDGTIADNVKVTKSLDPDLDRQAIIAVKQWTFRPGTKDGQAVPVQVDIELTFTLRDGPVYTVGAGVSAPQVITRVNPKYTDTARQAGVQGAVELSGTVETDGTIGSIRVEKGLDAELDQQAIQALSQWRFKPGQKDGADVRVHVNIEMTFTLK